MKFDASYSLRVKIITTAVIILFLGLGIMQISPALRVDVFLALSAPTLFLIILVVTYGLSVTKYEISSYELVICRPFKNKIIPKKDITSAERIYKQDLKWTFRVFGSGGLFGIYGNFFNKKIGTMNWFVTREDRLILIKTSIGKKYVVSPDEPEKFLDTLKSAN
ncbi:MAG TPA: PH domain-containing protein [Niabella sp.]|jgi:hypothetical protein|nr:PH domain-containing protein [Chitinophagaceae bacterium]HRN47649.1 PH domain-containing protein [Niabella sp.]HRO84421.1 PH domain-containing protein [Niabella sp.]HUN01384.1 PH domain-containing protein [Niabella sp.]